MHTALVQLDCGAVVDPKVLFQVHYGRKISSGPPKQTGAVQGTKRRDLHFEIITHIVTEAI